MFGYTWGMDAITILRNDHKAVELLFRRFEKAGDGARVEKRRIVDQIVEALSIHASIEEQVFYPVARATVPKTEDIALESLEEHHIVKWLLAELVDLDPTHERFDAKVTVLIENVRHHVKEEENDFFPLVRGALGRTALSDLGNALVEAKKRAPTHPHPKAPDVPPANALVGAIIGAVDRVGDNISGIAQGGVSAVQDLIARILHMQKPKTSPTGSSVTRSRATDVRRSAARATEGASQTARSAKTGAVKTAKAAASGAKATVTATKRSAATAESTAKRAITTTARTARSASKATAATARQATKKTAAPARGSRRAKVSSPGRAGKAAK